MSEEALSVRTLLLTILLSLWHKCRQKLQILKFFDIFLIIQNYYVPLQAIFII